MLVFLFTIHFYNELKTVHYLPEFTEKKSSRMQTLIFRSYLSKIYVSFIRNISNQTVDYVEEHLNSNGNYIIKWEESDDDILRCTIRSRHSNVVKYKIWIQYALIGDPIQAWYCRCAGARTIGWCVHVASPIWYLSFARHNDFISSQGQVLKLF